MRAAQRTYSNVSAKGGSMFGTEQVDSVCFMRWSGAVSGGLALTISVRSRPDSTGVPRESNILPATRYQELAAFPRAHSAAKISDALPSSSERGISLGR